MLPEFVLRTEGIARRHVHPHPYRLHCTHELAHPPCTACTAHAFPSLQVQYVMCPFLDFINHSSASQAECAYDWLQDSFKVVSDRPYQQGQQVFINYGGLTRYSAAALRSSYSNSVLIQG